MSKLLYDFRLKENFTKSTLDIRHYSSSPMPYLYRRRLDTEQNRSPVNSGSLQDEEHQPDMSIQSVPAAPTPKLNSASVAGGIPVPVTESRLTESVVFQLSQSKRGTNHPLHHTLIHHYILQLNTRERHPLLSYRSYSPFYLYFT